ncbi:SP family arabinose:H+ symporter-like MFS transporter [Paenibacillus forsythiae]|uniref:SP family arabinose:H+ symporter-like MFS transporter n=1 Tax=Paenibacillus forsythiae TaxID=365616 RepID=A0ABU3H262_9BACL|nr:sugar porter family MFS transporter [Paenibacillus forsythiae]MDT3424913.1 SP family arabinose:H+ symporter-like MFS transporter [Paenibacillus forsythiae]
MSTMLQHSANESETSIKFVVLVSMVAALGGFLFGFDTAVMSVANGFLRTRFELGDFMLGWTVSCLIIGCMAGAAISGSMGERFGRKKVLITAAVLYTAGIFVSALSPSLDLFIAARMIEGIGIGITSTLCPLYNAEIAPARFRGRLVAMNQMATVSGIFLGSFLAFGVSGMGNDAWDVSTGWRIMFGTGIVPGILFLTLLFLVPESPRWLIKKGRAAEALPILLKIHGEELAKKEVLDIKKGFAQDEEVKAASGRRFTPALRTVLIVGIIVAMLQQITGINAVMYYAPEIFRQTGAGASGSLTQTIMVGLVNLIFTALSLWLVDKLGRKVLLLAGSFFMTLSLGIIGFAFHTGRTDGPIVLICILVYVAAFAISLGAVVWVILSEIFPSRIRGLATAVATMALWGADFAVSQSFPPMLASAGPAITFWIFAATSLFTFLFTWGVIPETKGKSLEEIEAMWEKKHGSKQESLKPSLQD